MQARLRVLYAEDNAVDADLTKAHFAQAAPDVVLDVVDSGEQCLARLAHGTYDVLLLDHHLPDMDGVDVLRELAAREVPRIGLDVVRASADALVRLQNEQVDLLLADLRMPDMNALDLLRETRRRDLLLPAIVITGRGDERAAVAALKLGAYDYIIKRDDYLTHLPYAIDNAIGRFQLAQLSEHLQAELTERQRSQQATAESLALLDTLQRNAPI